MMSLLREKFIKVLKAVAALILSVCLVQFTLVHAPLADFLQFLSGSALAVAGMMLLFVGIDLDIVPMGRFIG